MYQYSLIPLFCATNMHTEESLAVLQCLRVPCVNSDVFHVAPQNAPCYLWRTKGELQKGPFMSESLAVRRAETSAAITRVHEVLDAFAARDEKGEMLTAVRHFPAREARSEEHTSELQSPYDLVCRLL